MRLKEIEERLAAIKNELTTRAAELKEEEITCLLYTSDAADE